MIRKEELIVGTKAELRDYYFNELKVKLRTETFLPVEGDNFELTDFDKQVENFKDFGMIFYLACPKCEKTSVDLTLESSYIRILPDNYYEEARELCNIIAKKGNVNESVG